MALVTHTPGPWTVERIPDEAKRDPELTMDADGAFWIAEACMAGEVLAIVTALPKDADAAEANARLMALAPDLLTALKETFAICETVMLAALVIPELDKEANAISDAWMLKAKELGIPDGFLDRAQAAIAKAEGK